MHASAAYLVGAAIWKELVQVDTIAQYSDEYSQATYMTPEGKRRSPPPSSQALKRLALKNDIIQRSVRAALCFTSKTPLMLDLTIRSGKLVKHSSS